MNMDSLVECRRAIEALRAGVPNRDAVRALGCEQPAIEQAFRDRLRESKEHGTHGKQMPGILVKGNFGTGKSHLLEYLQDIALGDNFICSKVVISKETPLHDPVKFYRSAIHSAVAPGRTGSALGEIAMALGLSPPSSAYNDLLHWVHNPECGLNSRFAATLFLVKHLTNPDEDLDRIIRFWSGEPIGAGELRRLLRHYGEKSTYPIESVIQRDLAVQRFQFAPRLMVAAGYAGWVLLVDEVELIGRYSRLQRGRSYAELARWAGEVPSQQFPYLTMVFAITSNFESEVLADTAKNDLENVPALLRSKSLDELAKHAERGMKFIQKKALSLKPSDEAVRGAAQRVRDIYAKAYAWEPRPLEPGRGSASTVMRQHLKSWINQWDLKRLYDYEGKPVIHGEETKQDYKEDSDFEQPTEENSLDPASG